MNKEHVVILVAGRTCAGKSSLVQKVCERSGATQLKSYTTRKKRNDADIDHEFIDMAFYENQNALNNIVAFTCISGNFYFCTKEQLYHADFYTIDKNGIDMLKSMNLPGIRFVTVYIKTDADIREHRAINVRKDDKVIFRKREFSERSQFHDLERNVEYDYCISNNGEFSKAYAILRYIALIEGALPMEDKTK